MHHPPSHQGSCSHDATCTFTSSGDAVCKCRPGYIGDGKQCDADPSASTADDDGDNPDDPVKYFVIAGAVMGVAFIVVGTHIHELRKSHSNSSAARPPLLWVRHAQRLLVCVCTLSSTFGHSQSPCSSTCARAAVPGALATKSTSAPTLSRIAPTRSRSCLGTRPEKALKRRLSCPRQAIATGNSERVEPHQPGSSLVPVPNIHSNQHHYCFSCAVQGRLCRCWWRRNDWVSNHHLKAIRASWLLGVTR